MRTQVSDFCIGSARTFSNPCHARVISGMAVPASGIYRSLRRTPTPFVDKRDVNKTAVERKT